MSNLTISVDDELIKLARVRAIRQGTSLSAKVREFLQDYVNQSDDVLRKQREDATVRLMRAIENATAQTTAEAAPSATRKRRTLRDDLYAGDFRDRDRKDAASRRGR